MQGVSQLQQQMTAMFRAIDQVNARLADKEDPLAMGGAWCLGAQPLQRTYTISGLSTDSGQRIISKE